mmetsp:Transcript_35677/g.114094  ORF Transcript_35677/g.114094 Transcript_35677/m.114094 type:complete len:231 (-) Transcript_35677:1220-1912(-)
MMTSTPATTRLPTATPRMRPSRDSPPTASNPSSPKRRGIASTGLSPAFATAPPGNATTATTVGLGVTSTATTPSWPPPTSEPTATLTTAVTATSQVTTAKDGAVRGRGAEARDGALGDADPERVPGAVAVCAGGVGGAMAGLAGGLAPRRDGRPRVGVARPRQLVRQRSDQGKEEAGPGLTTRAGAGGRRRRGRRGRRRRRGGPRGSGPPTGRPSRHGWPPGRPPPTAGP